MRSENECDVHTRFNLFISILDNCYLARNEQYEQQGYYYAFWLRRFEYNVNQKQ